MVKIAMDAANPVTTLVTTQKQIADGLKQGNFIEQWKPIIDSINELLRNFQAIRLPQAGLPSTHPQPPAGREVMSNAGKPPHNPPVAVSAPPSSSGKWIAFGKIFLDGLIQDGRGDETIGKIIAELPMKVSEVRALLEQIK